MMCRRGCISNSDYFSFGLHQESFFDERSSMVREEDTCSLLKQKLGKGNDRTCGELIRNPDVWEKLKKKNKRHSFEIMMECLFG
ncbi:MAG: hypothetical protein DRG63_05840 [Deltaproteobacteria bacterium]|mgnify:CR=1 FL=1|nr:MAG: hypothetical protein DRG63_05840 [Deltaproteobacteria bacterium]